MLSKDEIIATLAKEQNTLISRDDPVLAFLLIHQIILDSYAEKFEEQFEGNTQELVAELQNVQNEYAEKSKELANNVVGKAISKINEAEQHLSQALQQKLDDFNTDKNKSNQLEQMNFYILAGLLVVNIIVSIIGIIL